MQASRGREIEGGEPMATEASRHGGRLRAVAIVVLVIGVVGVLLFKWITVATPISKSQALEIFEEDNEEAGSQKIARHLRGQGRDKSEARGPRLGRGRENAREQTRKAGGSNSSSSQDPASSGAAPGFLTMPIRSVPEEGVYTYLTDGSEQMNGQGFREFPDRTYRNVVHTGSRSWTEHHVLLEERQMWSSFSVDGTSQVLNWTRQVVEFGGPIADQDETFDFEPPLRLWWLPWTSGRTWEGEWTSSNEDGESYGTYEVTTTDHGYLGIGDEKVEVWLEEISFVSHGHIAGTVEVKRWTSPEYGIAVREEFLGDVKKGPLTYETEYSVELTALEPAR